MKQKEKLKNKPGNKKTYIMRSYCTPPKAMFSACPPDGNASRCKKRGKSMRMRSSCAGGNGDDLRLVGRGSVGFVRDSKHNVSLAHIVCSKIVVYIRVYGVKYALVAHP